jgi:hypothetical protein
MSYSVDPSNIIFPYPSTISLTYNNGSTLSGGKYELIIGTTTLSTVKEGDTTVTYFTAGSGGFYGTAMYTMAVDNNNKIYIIHRVWTYNTFTSTFTFTERYSVYDVNTDAHIYTNGTLTTGHSPFGNSYFSSTYNAIYTPYVNGSQNSYMLVISTINYSRSTFALPNGTIGVSGDNSGNLYFTSRTTKTITRYNIANSTSTTAFSNPSLIAGDYLVYCFVANDGYIYALDSSGNIYKISYDGSTCTLFVSASSTQSPNSMCYNSLNGNIYAFSAVSGGSYVYQITPSAVVSIFRSGLAMHATTSCFYNVYNNSIYWADNNSPVARVYASNIKFPTSTLLYSNFSTSLFVEGNNNLRIYKDFVAYGVPISISSYTTGTAPTINSITTGYFSFIVNFTSGTGYNPSPTTYYYSLDNGLTYTNANTTISPILISGVNSAITYNIKIISNNLAGNTAPSNTVIGFIPYPCFLQGTKILCMNVETDEEEYIPIENLRRGDLVKTAKHGYKAIELIGFREIPNPLAVSKESGRLYWFRRSKVSELREDLCVTGDHCILHKNVTDEKIKQIIDYMKDIYVTEDHYRVPAWLDERSEQYKEPGPATIWHFALENQNAYFNYGVMANGLLVESSSIYCMYKDSNMQLMSGLPW